ncbi:hypothetical protein APHAL10511_004987 [Amanita phalloides]|nr:hypothetical protein APHAL10511_004987 [Amanita phalloides]
MATLLATGYDTFQSDTTDCESESDIVDQCFDLIDEEHGEIPQRPSSRLGFLTDSYATDIEDPCETNLPEMMNRPFNADIMDSGPSSLATAFSSTMAYGMDEDITSVASTHLPNCALESLQPPSIGLRITPMTQFDDAIPSSSDDESDFSDSESSSDCSYDNRDDDFDFPLPFPPSKLSLPSLVAPVARLPSLPPQRYDPPTISAEQPPIPPLRLPSPKLNHNDHGYSRHALHHVKWFWAVRQNTWADCDTSQRDCNAYDGIVSPSGYDAYGSLKSRTQRNNLTQHFKMKSPVPHSPMLPPMSIHPRRGDIASLRDPYCAHIDRCFVNLPSWTLAKTMYMFDVHVGCEWQNRLAKMGKWKQSTGDATVADQLQKCDTPVHDALDEVDVDSENESLGTSASVVSSDDSDATLVESEDGGDLERDDFSAFDGFGTDASPSSPSTSNENEQGTPRLKYSSPPTEQLSPKCSISPKLYEQMQSPRAEFFSSLNDDVDSMKPWATNWYRRWEILMELMRFNWGHDQLFAALSIDEHPYPSESQSCPSSSDVQKGKRRLKRQPRFFVDDDVAEDDSSWEWDSSLDLDTIGKISQPTYFAHTAAGSVLL